MTIWKPFRILFIKSTDFTHDYQQAGASKINKFYKLWAHCYDFTVGLDPAYKRELRNMVNSVVKQGDITLDIGCGTGLGTIYAAAIAKDAIGIDPSRDMTEKLQQKIQKRNIENIEIRNGYFPDVLTSLEKFDSVTSSFMLAHLVPESRAHLIANIFDCLNPGGRLGLFSAQGEIAPTFQIRGEILAWLKNLESQFDTLKIFSAPFGVIDRQMWDKIVEKAYFPHIWCSENVAGANGKLKCQTDFEPCRNFGQSLSGGISGYSD